MTNFFKRCRFYLAILIIVAAVLSSLVRALTPWVAQYQPDLERYLSTVLGHPVSISTMETGWYWFEPVIKLHDVAISNGEQKVIDAHSLMLGINLWSSLWHWQIEPGVLFVDDVHFTVRQQETAWSLDGFKLSSSGSSLVSLLHDSYLLNLFFAQQKLIFKNVSIDVYLKDGSLIPIKQLNLTIAKHFGRYQFKGMIEIERNRPTTLNFVADLSLNPESLRDTRGEVYVSLQNFVAEQWQDILPKKEMQLLVGLFDVEAWLTLSHAAVTKVQSIIDVQNLDFMDLKAKRHWRADKLTMNAAWKRLASGWQLSADQLQLQLKGQQWPVNQLQISHDPTADTWKIYVGHVLLSSLLAEDIAWPAAMKPLLAAKLNGMLQETQIHVQNQQVVYVLSHFNQLGWHAVGSLPTVKNISGVLFWQPDVGRLALDGENVVLKARNKPSVKLLDLNAALSWKKHGLGWNLKVEHVVVRHPFLLANVQGQLENFGVDAEELMQWTGHFSATNAQFWFKYLPTEHLKAKLVHWLQHDIKRISHVNADLTIAGRVHDFPFDRVVESPPSQLVFWRCGNRVGPLPKVARALCRSTPSIPSRVTKPGVFEVNAHVTGLDLVFAPLWPLTTDIDANLHYAQRTLIADVLNANLQGIPVHQVSLVLNDLGLDKDTLLVHGKVHTRGAKALAYLLTSPLSKKLTFLKLLIIQGLLDLDLKLEAALYPGNDTVLAQGSLAFHNNWVRVNHRLSQFDLERFNGPLAFNQDGALDSRLTALLLGTPVTLEVDSLEKPKSGTLVYVKGNVQINSLRQKLKLPFLERLEGACWLNSELAMSDGSGELDHAEIKSSLKGLQVKLPQPLGKSADETLPLAVRVDFKSNNQLAFDVHYGKFKSQVARLENGEWSATFNEPQLQGTVRYKPGTESFSGLLQKLYLPKELLTDNAALSATKLQASDLPSVNLHVKDFHYGDLDLGDFVLKANRQHWKWVVDEATISAPSYYIQAKGEWLQNALHNETTAVMKLQTNDLGKTLKRWNNTAVVFAKTGEVDVNGQWPGGFQDFSLNKLTGSSLILFRDGHITQFDRETEEKLGLGKLLSLINLQTLPRRLQLDFSDLSQKGYAFDIFRGHFAIKDGVMSTRDSYIDGPAASAGITGSIDIVQQRYDLELKIAPHLTASLPIVATIAGGPIAGAATWVATKIINRGMQKLSAYSYKVTGPWKKPDVRQINLFKRQ